MSNPNICGNGMFLAIAAGALGGQAMRRPPAASFHAASSRHPIKDQQSTIENPLDATQSFGGIPADVWTFRIGGYQVCEKWLKDRKGRTLDYADLQHYQKIIVALHETIHLMAAIDQTIAAHGGWPGAFGGVRQEVLA